jgi:hypothetical protein
MQNSFDTIKISKKINQKFVKNFITWKQIEEIQLLKRH